MWIKVGSVECGKLVDWAACVCTTIDYHGSTATLSAMFAKCSVNSRPCENTHGIPSAYCMCVENGYVLGTMLG